MRSMRQIGLTCTSIVLAALCLESSSSNSVAERSKADSQLQSSVSKTDSVTVQRPELALGRNSLYDYDPPEPGSYLLPALKPAGDGDALGSDGKRHRLRELYEDQISVVSFIYTRCADPKACPYATGVLYMLHQISKRDPVLAKNLHLVTFSFDPENDTPEVMASFERRCQQGKAGARWKRSCGTTRGVGCLTWGWIQESNPSTCTSMK